MKKLLPLVLVAVILLQLAACDGQQTSVGIDMDEQETSIQVDIPIDAEVPTNGPSEVTPDIGPAPEKIDYTLVDFLSVYSDGLMFATIETKDEYDVTACIDKAGKVVFTLDDGYTVRCGFRNGLAVLTKDNKLVLCDKTGKIITPEDVGATYFIYGSTNDGFKNNAYKGEQEAFDDGYILAVKNTTSYEGSVNELAVFNPKLEKILDFSKELFTFYYDTFAAYNKRSTYYNGYLFNKGSFMGDAWGYINLNTGEYSEDVSELSSQMPLKNKSDLWVVETGWGQLYFYNALENKDTVALDITKYNQVSGREVNIISVNKAGGYGFSYTYDHGYTDGTAGMIFTVEGRYYFTLLDETGEFCFEPVEIYGQVTSVKSDNGIYAFCTYPNNSTAVVQVFDKTGEIAKKEFISSHQWIESIYTKGIGIGDGVVCLELVDLSVAQKLTSYQRYILDLNLEPLFE